MREMDELLRENTKTKFDTYDIKFDHMTQKITVETYRQDKLYSKVVHATTVLLKDSDEISPVAILIQIGNLAPQDLDAWRHGRIPYLEKVFQGSLSKANRYLLMIGFHAHDLNMIPFHHTYCQIGKKNKLRFTRSCNPGIENSYARHFRWNQSQEKKQELIKQALIKLSASD